MQLLTRPLPLGLPGPDRGDAPSLSNTLGNPAPGAQGASPHPPGCRCPLQFCANPGTFDETCLEASFEFSFNGKSLRGATGRQTLAWVQERTRGDSRRQFPPPQTLLQMLENSGETLSNRETTYSVVSVLSHCIKLQILRLYLEKIICH